MVGGAPADTSGRIGIDIGVKDGRLLVVRAPEGKAGHRAGLRPGDHIARIDRQETAGMDRKSAAALMKGPVGEALILWIARAGATDLLRFDVVREREDIPSLAGAWKLLLGLGGVLLFVAAVVVLATSSTSPHEEGAKKYAAFLRTNDPQAAYALLASERRQALPYEVWLGTMNTPLLARASEMSVSSTVASSTGRGCVRASVVVDGGSVGLTFFTLSEGEAIRVHSVMTNEEQSGFVTRSPWSCN